MKNYFLICVLGCSLPSLAQQTEPAKARPRELKTIHSEATGGKKLVAVPDSLEGETLEHLNVMIQAIDNKVAYVKNDQTLTEKAEADGWFDKMAEYRARAVARREALIKTESGN